jgi:hypothetical protein
MKPASTCHPRRSTTEMLWAKKRWKFLTKAALQGLHELLLQHRLSVPSGDVVFLENTWYVTHTGLLRITKRNHCAGIEVEAVTDWCDFATRQWTFRATVYISRACRGFVGYGDANPTNVSAAVLGAEMRVAETRAVNRALRKAYGIGICSVEEIGSSASTGRKCKEDANTIREWKRKFRRSFRLRTRLNRHDPRGPGSSIRAGEHSSSVSTRAYFCSPAEFNC